MNIEKTAGFYFREGSFPPWPMICHFLKCAIEHCPPFKADVVVANSGVYLANIFYKGKPGPFLLGEEGYISKLVTVLASTHDPKHPAIA